MRILPTPAIALVILLILGASLATAQTKPAINLSTPTEALVSFARAAVEGNSADALETIVGTDAEKERLKQIMRGMAAQRKLVRAYDAAFGGNSAKHFSFSAETEKQIRDAKVAINGDTATLEMVEGNDTMKLTLKQEKDGWKFVVADFLKIFEQGKKQDSQEVERQLKTLESATNEIVANVEDGAYATREDADKAFTKLLMPTLATTRPAAK